MKPFDSGSGGDEPQPVTYEHRPRLSAEELLASWPPSKTRSGEWAMAPGLTAVRTPAEAPPQDDWAPLRSDMDES